MNDLGSAGSTALQNKNQLSSSDDKEIESDLVPLNRNMTSCTFMPYHPPVASLGKRMKHVVASDNVTTCDSAMTYVELQRHSAPHPAQPTEASGLVGSPEFFVELCICWVVE